MYVYILYKFVNLNLFEIKLQNLGYLILQFSNKQKNIYYVDSSYIYLLEIKLLTQIKQNFFF